MRSAMQVSFTKSTNYWKKTTKILTRQIPTFEEFHQMLLMLRESTKEVGDNSTFELSSLLSLSINSNNMNNIKQYAEGMREWTSKISFSSTPAQRDLCIILQISDAIKQLSIAEYATPSPLLIFPIFQGKDVYKMTSKFEIINRL